MEIKITTRQILNVLQVFSWILFIGLCLQAGGIIFSALYAFWIDPASAANIWEKVDLSELYAYDPGHFLAFAGIAAIASALKAILFYVILMLFVRKEVSIVRPFTTSLVRFVLTASGLSLAIGFFCHYGYNYSAGLEEKGVPLPDLSTLHLDGADVWIFMAVVLFMVAQVIRRGVEIQDENELTV